jgi:GntR family transcriptional repressor for pyruvate dehydrogenase complex
MDKRINSRPSRASEKEDDSLLEPPKKDRRFQTAVKKLEEAILDGHLSVGETLPSERELKRLLGMSRNTLREALRVLEERGLIKIKKGVRGGSIVNNITTKHATETLGLLIRSKKVSLKDLIEFRRDVEGTVASLAAQRADEHDIEQLKMAYEHIANLINENTITREQFFEVDKQFHIELARMCKNPVYLIILRSVHENIQRYYAAITYEKQTMMESFRFFELMINAVIRRDFNEAKILAENHVLNLIHRQGAI